MPITLGNSAGPAASADPLDISLVVQAADDYIVAVVCKDSGSIDSVTIDPGGGDQASFTQEVTATLGPTQSSIWSLRGANVPGAGTYTIRVEHTDILAGEGPAAYARALQGAADAVPEATNTATAGSGQAISTDITTLTNGAMVFDAVSVGISVTGEAEGGGQTAEFTQDYFIGDSFGSREPDPTAGTVTMSWSWSGLNSRIAHALAAFAPAAGPETIQEELADLSGLTDQITASITKQSLRTKWTALIRETVAQQ